jgi:hypothetical protein
MSVAFYTDTLPLALHGLFGTLQILLLSLTALRHAAGEVWVAARIGNSSHLSEDKKKALMHQTACICIEKPEN